MPTPSEKEAFLKAVLSYITFPFDRSAIRKELEDHIDDRVDDLMKEGLVPREAVHQAIVHMGNPADIGKELNQMHKPLLGWIWKISDLLVKGLSIVLLLLIMIQLLLSINLNSPSSYINPDQVVYHLTPNEERRIDDQIIKVTDILYLNDGSLHLFYQTYSASLFISPWQFSNIGTLSDDLGNNYMGGGSSSSGFISHHIIQLNHFDEKARQLNIVYDAYNRHFEFHFNLPLGGSYE